MEENLHVKIDWASLIVGSKLTIFALFYFVFVGNFPSTSPWGAYIWRGDLTEGFLRYQIGGAYIWRGDLTEGFLRNWIGGAYIWRGLYMEGLIFGILRYFILDYFISFYFFKYIFTYIPVLYTL